MSATPIEKAVEQAQANLTSSNDRLLRDTQSWEIFVASQMQRILDAAVTENAENVRFALRLGAAPGEARADALDVKDARQAIDAVARGLEADIGLTPGEDALASWARALRGAIASLDKARADALDVEALATELQEALDALSKTPPHPATAASVLRGVLAILAERQP